VGSNSITTGRQLVNPELVVSSTLGAPTGPFGDNTPIPAEEFTTANGLVPGTYRYLQFQASTAHYPSPYNNPGLNEIEVFGTLVPSNPTPGPNVALGKPVVASSGTYPFLAGFEAQRVTDGSTSDMFQKTYWLTPDNAGAGSYLVVDLEGLYDVTGIGLRNTHNSQFNDRNTRNFLIRGSDTLSGDNLAGAPVILSGGLPNVSDQSEIELFQFARDNGLVEGDYRYLRFEIVSAINNAGGLNEIEVYGTLVPEPGALGVFAAGAAALLMRRRR
jgi:hypothetical protein